MLDIKKLNAMKAGIFKGISYYGYTPSVLKSGICKYYRRGIWDKFEWAIVEMALFLKANDGGKGLFTNLINRLKILLMEEIVYSQINDVAKAIKVLEEAQCATLFEDIIAKLLLFCEIVKHLKRGRLVSYINNVAKCNIKKEKWENITIDKVLPFKKDNDSELLLKLGELFINYLKDDRELALFNALNIYCIFMKCEKQIGTGTRYRRKDPVYLIWAILENESLKFPPETRLVIEFAKTMFFRKAMKERPAFGVWAIAIIKFSLNNSNANTNLKTINDFKEVNIEDYFENRPKIEINEGFVVKDYHVNKSYGLKKFAEEGAFVENEDLSLLGKWGAKLKEYYISIKSGSKAKFDFDFNFAITKAKVKVITKAISKAKVNTKPFRVFIVEEQNLPLIPWEKFENVKVLEAGVCGLKVCTIKVSYKNKPYILKEMRPSFRLGRDYMFLDSVKRRFNVAHLGMWRLRSTKKLEQVDRKKRTLVGNWKLSEDSKVVYCIMNEFENVGDLGKNKHFLQTETTFYETLKIMLFDGLFRSSDNILRNILVNKKGEVMSIDEGDIYGKRKEVFGKHDWFKKVENIEKTKVIAQEIITKWKLNDKIEMIATKMKRFGFNDKVEEMTSRFKDYSSIIKDELR